MALMKSAMSMKVHAVWMAVLTVAVVVLVVRAFTGKDDENKRENMSGYGVISSLAGNETRRCYPAKGNRSAYCQVIGPVQV